MGIRDKLVIIFFALIIIPMFLLWARWQETAVGSTKAVLQREAAERASEISDQVTSSLQSNQKQIVDLTKQGALASYGRELGQNPQAVPNDLLRIDLSAFLLAHQNLFAAVVGVNRDGRPVFKIEPRQLGNGIIRPFYESSDFSRDDEIPELTKLVGKVGGGGAAIGEIQRERKGTTLSLIAPLRDDASGVGGALVVKIRVDRLLAEAVGPQALIDSTSAENKRPDYGRPQAIIVGNDGQVLYAADETKLAKPLADGFAQFLPAFNRLRESGGQDDDSEPWLVHYRSRNETPGLSILIVQDYTNALGQVEFDSYVLLLLTFLLVIVAMLSIYFLISGTTDSIRRVTNGARAIATGNLGYNIQIKSKDETRVLAEAFNRMAGRLREMIRKEGEQKQFESFARLSAVLTHDLKNQILSLSLLVSNMERKFDREGFREDALRTLSESVNNLQNLVSKLSDPRTPTKRVREQSNLTTLVKRVIDRTAAQAASRFQVQTNLLPDVFANVDGKAIERVIENLVINALEAMQEGGNLMVATRRDGENAIISVADTGKGMTEEFMRERLFQPFATTKKKGIGLGLYSCRDIIEQHGGRIDVASQVGRGTEFSVVLPIKGNNTSSLSDSSGEFITPVTQLKNQAD
jgi:signal transduction histidine kinase